MKMVFLETVFQETFCENICDTDYEQITGDGIMEKTTELLMGFRSLLRLSTLR